MARAEKIRLIYAIFLGVFFVAVGIAVICVAADIYYSGAGTGVVYTREIVSERLLRLAIPVIMLIAAIAVGAVFPAFDTKIKPKTEDAVEKLRKRLPTGGEGEEFDSARRAYIKTKNIRLMIWIVAIAAVLACAIAILCYLLNVANFSGEDVTAEVFKLAGFVMPFTLAALIALIVAAAVNGVVAKKQLDAVKKLIKCGNKEAGTASDPAVIALAKSVWNSAITLWAMRGVLLVIAVTFIIVGICNGGAHDVLVKAINICQECIGLG